MMYTFWMRKNTSRRMLKPLAGFVLAAGMMITVESAYALDKGSVAPVFDLAGPNGQVKLADHAGKLVYLDFWASWCGPCRKSFPWMNQMQAKYGAQGLQVVGINVDAKAEDAQRFLAETPARFPVAFDPLGSTPRSYGIKGMPTSVLIGVDGKVIFQHAGFNDVDKGELETKIRQALGAGK